MDYTALRDDLVIPMIEKYGKAVSLRRPGTTLHWTRAWNAADGRYQWTYAGPPNPPADGTIVYVDPAATPVDYPGHAIEKAYQQEEIDNTTVMANDRRFLLIDTPEPTSADKLVVGSSILTVVRVSSIQPGDTALVRILQCRGV
jgi:hypothetical protein